MSARQIELTLVLLLVAVVMASAVAIAPSKSAVQNRAIMIDVPEQRNGSVSQALLASQHESMRVKLPPVRSPSPPAYELNLTENSGAIWDQGPAYDLSTTGQSSIYIYVP